MQELLQEPEARAVVGVTIVLIISSILVYVVMKIRGWGGQDAQSRGEYLSDFREMYEEGAISEFEFRRVKSELGSSVKQAPLVEQRDAEPKGNDLRGITATSNSSRDAGLAAGMSASVSEQARQQAAKPTENDQANTSDQGIANDHGIANDRCE